MKSKMKRLFCMVMAVTMIFGILSVSVTAQEDVNAEVSRVSVVMNGDSSASRGISWYTSSKTGSDVQVVLKSQHDAVGFAKAKTYTGEISKWQGKYCHKVVVDGLEAGETYVYRAGDQSLGVWSDVGTFKTNASSDAAFSYIAIADVQASNYDNFKRGAAVMKKAMETAPDASFYINLGDYVNDCTDEEWTWYFDAFKDINLSLTQVPVAGNHDGNLKWNWFNSMFNIGKAEGSKTTTGVYYSYDYGNVHYAVLNTNDMYPMSQEQQNWLINDMKQSDADWKIVLMHRASYSAGKNINKPDTLIMRNVLLPLFEELDIDMVYAGHDHVYYRSYQVSEDVVQPTTYVTEDYNGEQIKFAVNPAGTVHVVPNTAGTKRYRIFHALDPILDCAEVVYQPGKPVFSVTQIDGDKLIYKAYAYDEETTEISLIDTYAIKKDRGQNTVDPDYVPLTTDSKELAGTNVMNLCRELVQVTCTYVFRLLPQAIKDAIKG